MNRILTRTLLGAGATAMLVLPACSDDDDTAADTTDATEESTDATAADETTTTAAAPSDAFCDAVIEADAQFTALQGPAGDPAAAGAAVDAVEASAPEELAAQSEAVATEARSMLDGSAGDEGPSDEFMANYGEMVAWMADGNCSFPTVAVEAENYAFNNIPDTMPAGETLVQFTNVGTELHEVLILRPNDGVTESLEEILALPEDEAQGMVTTVAQGFAMPGEESWTTARLDPGAYVAICFIPEGFTPEAMAEMEATGAEPEGAPHFTLGMVKEFTVE